MEHHIPVGTLKFKVLKFMNLTLVTEETFALCLSVQPRAISIDAKQNFSSFKTENNDFIYLYIFGYVVIFYILFVYGSSWLWNET